MSHDATVAAWAHIRSHSDLDALGVLVLLALADRHNALTGKLNPSIGRIAADCHCSPASVKRALHKLESLGLIARGSGGGAASSTYRLLIPSPVPKEPGSDRTRFTQHREGVHTAPGGGSHRATNQERTRNEPGRSFTPKTVDNFAAPDCTDCAGSGWATIDHATNTVARCGCRSEHVA